MRYATLERLAHDIFCYSLTSYVINQVIDLVFLPSDKSWKICKYSYIQPQYIQTNSPCTMHLLMNIATLYTLPAVHLSIPMFVAMIKYLTSAQ